MDIILSRKKAFKLAWLIFWMATGTKRMRITLGHGEVIRIDGDALIEGD